MRWTWLAAACALGLAARSHAMWFEAPRARIPVARLMDALTEQRQARPDDAVVARALGRLHHLLFTTGSVDALHLAGVPADPDAPVQADAVDRALADPDRPPPRPGSAAAGHPRTTYREALPDVETLNAQGVRLNPFHWPITREPRQLTDRDLRDAVEHGATLLGWCPSPCLDAARTEHLVQAHRHLSAATALDRRNGIAELGLAELILSAQGARARGETAGLGLDLSPSEALRHLRRAQQIAATTPGRVGPYDLPGSALRKEVGVVVRHLDDLLHVHDAAGRPAVAGLDLDPLVEARAEHAAWWRMAIFDPAFDEDRDPVITPLAFRLSDATYAEVDAPERTVSFDLDGLGGRSWSWVQPGTALLVWDPEREGRPTSGADLLGERAWWLFLDDGFQALALLDDDRDGRVVGRELDGVRLWFDDGDGVSHPSEVVDPDDVGVLGFAVRDVAPVDGILTHPHGVLHADGTWPLFDWLGTSR